MLPPIRILVAVVSIVDAVRPSYVAKANFVRAEFAKQVSGVNQSVELAASAWTTTTDSSHGPCADHLEVGLPISFPLLCTGESSNLTFSVTSRGWGWSSLYLEVDGQPLGSTHVSLFPTTQTWKVPSGTLSVGLHNIKYSGNTRDSSSVVVWSKWMCVLGVLMVLLAAPFCIVCGCARQVLHLFRPSTDQPSQPEDAPSQPEDSPPEGAPEIEATPSEPASQPDIDPQDSAPMWFTTCDVVCSSGKYGCMCGCTMFLVGIVVIMMVGFGGVEVASLTLEGSGEACHLNDAPGYAAVEQSSYTYRGFDVLNRMFGPDQDFSDFKKRQLFFTTESVGRNADGSIDATVVAEGMWQWLFSYSQPQIQAADDPWLKNPTMYEEYEIKPLLNVSLDLLPGHAGETMVVAEACNGLSNLAMHEASVWVSCKGYPFEPDEFASLIAGFSALAAGSTFMHFCACSIGHQGDVLPMKWWMLQMYQILVKEVVRLAAPALTQREEAALLYMGEPPIVATDVAKTFTALFKQEFDSAVWREALEAIKMQSYEKSIAGVIIFVLVALEDKWPSEGIKEHVNTLVDVLFELFGIGEREFYTETYMPAARKALWVAPICQDSVMDVLEHFLKFALTFIDALIYQEEMIPVPEKYRNMTRWLERNVGISSGAVSDMEVTWDYYNGYDCKERSDHSTWHEKAAHGLVHALDLAELFVTRVKRNTGDC